MRAESSTAYREVWGDRLEQHWIEGMDHGFGTLANRDRMLELTVEFLVRTT